MKQASKEDKTLQYLTNDLHEEEYRNLSLNPLTDLKEITYSINNPAIYADLFIFTAN